MSLIPHRWQPSGLDAPGEDERASCGLCRQPPGSHALAPGRRVGSVAGIERPGDYFGPSTSYTGDLPAVLFLKPNARDPGVPARARSIQHVCSPPHEFRECADGSLEIRPSISARLRGDADGHSDDGWHGYLDEGHQWRQV